jgi:hypothetical protein
MANVKTLPNLQAPSRSPSPAQTLPSEAVLDALKMMLIGASLNEVLTSITRLIEAHSEGMLCSIFLLDEDGLHLRYGVAPNLPQAYLVLLCYKKGAPQKGQLDSCRSRTRAMICRRLAIEQGLCRSTRTGRAPRAEFRRQSASG